LSLKVIGNRTPTWVNGARTTQHTYTAANQVVDWTYDAAGNLTHDGTTTYRYDALGRLTQHGSTTNSYNGDGVLVAQDNTRYTQDLQAPLSQILHDGTATHVYGHARLASVRGSTRTWYGTDALGSVRQTLSDSGSVASSTSYDPWGQVTQGTVATWGFTGELQQEDALYLRARWYQPSAGMLLGRDPFAGYAALPYSLHPYHINSN
jgi:RHS repeat-associated protein